MHCIVCVPLFINALYSSFQRMMQSVKAYSGFRAVNARIIPQVVSRSPASGRRGTLQIMNARVGGVEIPNAKPIEYSLQYIFGIGHTTAKAICVDTVRPPCIVLYEIVSMFMMIRATCIGWFHFVRVVMVS